MERESRIYTPKRSKRRYLLALDPSHGKQQFCPSAFFLLVLSKKFSTFPQGIAPTLITLRVASGHARKDNEWLQPVSNTVAPKSNLGIRVDVETTLGDTISKHELIPSVPAEWLEPISTVAPRSNLGSKIDVETLGGVISKHKLMASASSAPIPNDTD